MDSRSQEMFALCEKEVLTEAASRYGTDADSLTRLGSFESLVYQFNHGARDHILKITHRRHRTPEQVRGELDWTTYLFDNGVPVSRTVPSIGGQLLEVIDGRTAKALRDDYFLAYVMEKASGKITGRKDWTGSFVRQWGQLVGRMNALAKAYRPSEPAWKRFEWHEDNSLKLERHIPDSQSRVIEKGRSLMEYMRTWPTDIDSYGLIHSDMHHGNFVSDGDGITVFDFDDCHYGWFGFDISIPLFYVLRDHQVDPDDTEFARRFFSDFIKGYRQENNIDGIWIERIPDFLKLREIDLYSVIYAEKAADSNEWCRRFFENRRSRIENDIPVIDLDFSEFV